MRSNYLLAAEIKKMLLDFYADFFPHSVPPGFAKLPADYEPLRLVTIDGIDPYVRKLMDLKTEIPIQWQFGAYTASNSSHLLITRALTSMNIGEALEVMHRYQQLLSNFLVVSHERLADDGIAVRISATRPDNPAIAFILRWSTAAVLFHLFNLYSASKSQHDVDLRAASYPDLIERINAEIDFVDVSFKNNVARFRYPRETLDHRLPDQSDRLRAMLDMELRRRGIDIQARGTWKDRIKYHIRSDHLLGASFGEICDTFRMEKRTLSRLLRSEGTTFTDILKELRREKAIALIRNTDIPLKRVATEVGFNSDASFNMAFKSWTGMTPKAFRKSGSTSQVLA